MATAQRKPGSKAGPRGETRRAATAGQKSGPTPVRVLIVDENREDVARIEHCLGQMVSYKAEVEHAASLAETQSAIEAKKFDIALIDFHLGKETGTRIMRELGGRASDVALIFLTGPQGGDIKNQALEAGAFHLVPKKDVTPDVLDNAIHSSLHTQKIESKLNDALVDLERATRARADFFAKIGHDLKTPLNSVIGFSEAIAEETFGPIDNPKYREYAQAVREAGTHLLELIDNLIHFSIGDHQEIAFQRADLNALASSALKMTELACQKREHALKKKLSPNPVFVQCQASAITQAIINLLTNAIKYSGTGGRIEVSVRDTGRHAEVVIKDRGIGMSAADISVALKPFGRVQLPSDVAQEGTGLGLHIVREIMARHKGQLDISSAPGKGTTTILRLPKTGKRAKFT